MHPKHWLVVGLWLSGCGSEPGALTTSADPVRDGGTATPPNDADADARASRDTGSKKPDARTSPEADASGETPCEARSVSSTPTIPEMLIVLDRSGSMNPSGNELGTDRWTGSVDAIVDVTSSFDRRIDFGLMTFPAYLPNTGLLDEVECAPGAVDVAIASGSSTAIADVLGSMPADGRTPTAPSLEVALELLAQPQAADGVAARPRYVLLVTDGDPNCGSGSLGNGTDTVARQQTIAAIQALADAGIKTYVVGYQTAGTTFAQQLDLMAAAGATGETVHRSVASGADLSASFEQVAARVISCSQTLESPVLDPSYVQVTVNGAARAFNAESDGWTLGADDRTVTLTGAACDQLQSGATFQLEVQCAPVQVL